jgi:hypothetical protein
MRDILEFTVLTGIYFGNVFIHFWMWDLSIANRDSTVIRMYLANKVMGCQKTGNCVAVFWRDIPWDTQPGFTNSETTKRWFWCYLMSLWSWLCGLVLLCKHLIWVMKFNDMGFRNKGTPLSISWFVILGKLVGWGRLGSYKSTAGLGDIGNMHGWYPYW